MWQGLRLDHLEAALLEPVAQVARVLEYGREELRALLGAHDTQRRERGAERRRHGARREEEGTRLDPQVLDDVGRAGDEAAAGGQRLGERAHSQIDPILDAEQL